MNTPTPETDALELSLTTWTISDLDKAMKLCRKLERERDVAIGNLEAALNSYHAEQEQRRKAEERLEKLQHGCSQSPVVNNPQEDAFYKRHGEL